MSNSECFIGFDGFIDEIIHPIKNRESKTYIPFSSMNEFSQYIKKASHKSCNIELAIQEVRLGGNAPIMANALASLGCSINFAGTLGKKKILPIFEPFIKKCKHVISFENPGHTDAIEFPEGKIILGKLTPLQNLSYLEVIKKIGRKQLQEFLEKCTLFASANWTMLPMMNKLWEFILKEIAPSLSKKQRFMFVDLADPAKRSNADIREALEVLVQLNHYFTVFLGLNHSEAIRVAKVLNLKKAKLPEDLIQALHEKLGFSIVLHHAKFSYATNQKSLAKCIPPYNPRPKTTTGAGDNFNAGFCYGLLKGFSLKRALITGNANAGFYIKEGRSPNSEELAIYLRSWDNIKE